jgi:hypothetical protein
MSKLPSGVTRGSFFDKWRRHVDDFESPRDETRGPILSFKF